MQVVPLSANPSQQLSIVLAQQNCQINVYQKSTGVFFDLTSNGASVVRCVIARDGVHLVGQSYGGFIGNFIFVDTQGADDPVYTGFGTRYFLVYLEADDL